MAEPLRALIEDLGIIAETARPKVKTMIVRRHGESGSAKKPSLKSPDPQQKNDGIKGRVMRDLLP
jgi:hypothetical protein